MLSLGGGREMVEWEDFLPLTKQMDSYLWNISY